MEPKSSLRRQLARLAPVALSLALVLPLSACGTLSAGVEPTSTPYVTRPVIPTETSTPVASPTNAATATVTPTVQVITATPEATAVPPTATPKPATNTPPPVAVTAADVEASVQTVIDYWTAVNNKDYATAYAKWMQQGGASGLSYDKFVAGYANTVQVGLQLAQPGSQGTGAARKVTVPVTLTAVVNLPSGDQKFQHFTGAYTLQPEGGAWRFATANIKATPTDEVPVPPDLAKPVATLQAYFAAINARKYALAYTYWNYLGTASKQTFAQFEQGFATTRRVEIQLGNAVSQGAAGSTYTDVPVLIVATQTDGSVRYYCATYTLRKLNVEPFDQFGQHIEQASVTTIGAVQLGSAAADHLLANGCKP